MDVKKQKEKDILFSVYNKILIESTLIEDETPDFILTNPDDNLKIGVEITTVFSSQASAITRNDIFLDNYIDKNRPGTKANKKKPPHLNKLKVADVIGGEGFVHKSAVVWHISSLEEQFSFLENIINQKQIAYESKIKNLEFVTLIAKDEDCILKQDNTKVGELYGLIRSHNLFNTVISSNFQEINYVTEFKSGKYNIPLVWLIFSNEFAIFKKFWEETIIPLDPQKNNAIKLLLNNFCVCMLNLGFKNIYLFEDPENNYLFFGTHYWKLNKETNTFNETSFLALKLPEELKASQVLKNYKNYLTIYSAFLKYREEIIPLFEDGYFLKLL